MLPVPSEYGTHLQIGENICAKAFHLQNGGRPMGQFHLATFCSTGRLDVPSANTLSNLVTFCPINRQDKCSQVGRHIRR